MTYYCAGCSYCLRGLPDDRACPECGGETRRPGARDSGRIRRLIFVGLLAAVLWGVVAIWGGLKAADRFLSGPALTGVSTHRFSGPKSGRYEAIAIESRATREMSAALLPEVITASYELTILHTASPDGTPRSSTHKGRSVPTVEEALELLADRAKSDDPDLRREAMVVVQTIRQGLVPPYSGNSIVKLDPPETSPPIEFIREDSAFASAGGLIMMSSSVRSIPLIAKGAGLGVLLTGWMLIGFVLRRALRRAGLGVRPETRDASI